MSNTEELQPINRNYVFFGGCLTLCFTLFIISMAIRAIPKPPAPTQATSPFSVIVTEPSMEVNLQKYDSDSDGDRIPNFLEDMLGYNSFESEIAICDRSYPTCTTTPYDSKIRVNFLIDASSSMDIVATDKSKLNTIKTDLKELLQKDFEGKNNISFSLYSFGNKGSRSFISESESCISVMQQVDTGMATKNYGDLPLLVPNGKSPIAYTIREVAKTMNPADNNIFVLITDSLDDCGGNIDSAVKEALQSGRVSKVSALTYYANEDANIEIERVIKNNGGDYAKGPEIRPTIKRIIESALFQRWCHYQDHQKLVQCIESSIQKPIAKLQEIKIDPKTSSEEIVRINFVIGGINLISDNFLKGKREFMQSEFNRFINPPKER